MPNIELPSDELLERYDRGEMTTGQRAEFEERLLTDPVLARRLRDYREVVAALQLVAQRRQLRDRLRGIQHKLDLQEDLTGSHQQPRLSNHQTVAPMRVSWLAPVQEFWRAHRLTMGVAASVAILAAFSTFFLTAAWNRYKRESAYGYAVLRREVEKIKRTQKAIIRDINATSPSNDVESPLPASFSGTGFALSTNGYLVTSYHVVKDADSVLVEGGPDHMRYRAATVYRDEAHDLAILRITDRHFKTLGRLPYTFKKTDADLGERVYTLGYPREDVVYGEGALASRTGYEGDSAFYQVSVPVNPGNSGGPLLDDRGNLIGIISGRQLDVQSAAFAVKSTALIKLLENLPSNDTATVKPELPRGNQLTGSRRPEQLRRLQDFVFVVKVYN